MIPTLQKRLLFSAGGLLGFSSALATTVACGLPFWVNGTVLCQTGVDLVNASKTERDMFLGEMSYGLFHGRMVKQCGLGGRASRFSVFPELLGAVPAGLHVSIIIFCVVVILFSSVATGFFFFNAFGRPYETLQGPMGLYLWSFISCSCSCLVMILFASELKLHRLSERIANFNEVRFVFKTENDHYDRCFWLLLLVFLLNGLNIVLIRLTGIQFPFSENKEVDLSGGAVDLMY